MVPTQRPNPLPRLDRLHGLLHGNRALWIVAAVALCVHAPGIFGHYTFDDMAAVLGHPAVTGQAPLIEVFSREYWGRSFDAGWSSSYRPITTLTFALSHRITTAPWLHHAFNIVTYAGLCVLVVVFLRRHLSAAQASVAGLLFAVLPIHVENVASIVGRADVLAAGFALIALILAGSAGSLPADSATSRSTYLRAGRLAIGAAVAYLLAMLSKEGVALLPGLAAWFVVVRRRKLTPLAARAAALPVAALACTGIVYLIARQQWLPVGLPHEFIDADNTVRGLHGPARWWANLSLLGSYGEIAAVPARLCVDHTYGDVMPPQVVFSTSPATLRAWFGAAVVGLTCWDGWRAWRGRSAGLLVAFGLAYVLVGQWLIDLSVTFAERLFLWPSIFAVGALVVALTALARTQPTSTQRRLRVAFMALALLYAARTAQRSLDWRTPVALYASSAEACPAAVHNRFNLAKAYQARGRPDEALWHFAVALAGHRAWPAPFAPKAFAVEHSEPLSSRLQRLPMLLDLGGSPEQVWAGLETWLWQRGASHVARLAHRRGLSYTAHRRAHPRLLRPAPSRPTPSRPALPKSAQP